VAHVGQKLGLDARGGFGIVFGQMQLFFQQFVGGDVGANANVVVRQAVAPDQRDDGGVDPIKCAVFLAVFNLAAPHLTLRDGVPHFLEQGFGMLTRFDDTVVLTNQFICAVAADVTKALVGVSDVAIQVGDADDGMLVKGEFLAVEFGVLQQKALRHYIECIAKRFNLGRAM